MNDEPITIRILQPINRLSDNGGDWMSFEPGDIEEDIYIDELGCAVINWG